jgi:heterodisulfide reductase subunit A
MMHGFSESYYTQARRAGVIFIPYDPQQPPQVDGSKQDVVTIRTRDPIADVDLEITADQLVLATGVVPRLPAQLAAFYGATLDANGFFQEADTKWRPVDGLREGVFACGLTLAPQTITEAAAAGQAAAQRALRILRHERLGAGHPTAMVRSSLCVLCERCISACPYGARTIDPEQHKMIVHPAMCQGCGACAAVCLNGAALLSNHSAKQMLAMIDAAIG